MRASSAPGEPTRLVRARAAVMRVRRTVPDVPAGLAGLTDRVLPYLFPTVDAAGFAETLRLSVAVESAAAGGRHDREVVVRRARLAGP